MACKIYLLLLIVYCTISYGNCEKIQLLPCSETDPKEMCKVNEIRVKPCKEALLNKPCVLKRGYPASIELDFQALKSAESIKGLAYGVIITDIPFSGMDENGCKFTQCPIVAGSNQTYIFDLIVAKIYPRGKFNVKFKIWDENNEGCCSRFYLKLI